MSHPVTMKRFVHLCLYWPWVMAMLWSAVAFGAVVDPDVRPELPPPGVYDYRTLGSDNTKELYFGVPKEMELFGDPEKLKVLCVHFGGFSIDWSKKENSDRNSEQIEQLARQFDTYFGRESQFPEDRCRAITAGTLPEVTLESTHQIQDDRLLLRFKEGGSRWVSLLSVTRFVQCITKNYRSGSDEEGGTDPHCEADVSRRSQSGDSHTGNAAQGGKSASPPERSLLFSSIFKFCKLCELGNFKKEDKNPAKTAENLGKFKDGDELPAKIAEKRHDEGHHDPEDRSFFARAFLPDQQKPDYFLSRAFLAPQNLCGIHIKDTGNPKKTERCQVPELIRVGLVEGHVGRLTLSNNLSRAFPVAFFKPFFQEDGEYSEDRKESERILKIKEEITKIGNKNECKPFALRMTEIKEYTVPKNNNEFYCPERNEHIITNSITQKDYYRWKCLESVYKLIGEPHCKTDDGNTLNYYFSVINRFNERIEKNIEDKKTVIDLLFRTKSEGTAISDKLSVPLEEKYKKIKEQISHILTEEENKHRAEIEKLGYYFWRDTHMLYDDLKRANVIDSEKQAKLDPAFLRIKKNHLNTENYLNCDDLSEEYSSTTHAIPSKLCQILQPLQDEKPVTRLKLDQVLMQASDLPGTTVSGVLEPTTEDPNHTDMTNLNLEQKFQRWDWAVGADNYGSDFMGPIIYWHRLGLNYFSTPGDTLSWLYVQTPNENQLAYNQLDYRFPIGHEGYYGRFNLIVDQAKLGGTLEKLDIKTKSESGEVAFGHTSQIDRYMKRSLELGIHATNIKTTLLDHDHTHDRVTEAFLKMDAHHKRPIQELGIQPRERIDQLPGLEELSLTLIGSQGIKWNNNYIIEGDFRTSRAEAGPEFFLLKANLKGTREFRKITRTSDLYDMEHLINCFIPKSTMRLYISGALESQWSSEPLLSPKEMSFGGRKYGSAYEAGKIAGDHALAIKGELGYKFLTAFETDFKSEDNIPIIRNLEYSTFLFTEFGQVWNRDIQNKLKGTQNDEILTGGVGMRFNFQPKFLEQREANKPQAVIPIHQLSVEMLLGWPLGGSPVSDTADRPEFRAGVVLQLFIPELGQ